VQYPALLNGSGAKPKCQIQFNSATKSTYRTEAPKFNNRHTQCFGSLSINSTANRMGYAHRTLLRLNSVPGIVC